MGIFFFLIAYAYFNYMIPFNNFKEIKVVNLTISSLITKNFALRKVVNLKIKKNIILITI